MSRMVHVPIRVRGAIFMSNRPLAHTGWAQAAIKNKSNAGCLGFLPELGEYVIDWGTGYRIYLAKDGERELYT